MESIYKIEDRLLRELDEIASKMEGGEPMSHDCLDDIKDISEAINNFSTYTAMKESGFSQESGMGGYSGNGRSYARGRGSDANRDSMGRYSTRGRYSRNSYGRMMDEGWDREPYGMY